jgi:hypothetical protein
MGGDACGHDTEVIGNATVYDSVCGTERSGLKSVHSCVGMHSINRILLHMAAKLKLTSTSASCNSEMIVVFQ